jgi:hypothetical protein
MQFTFDWRGVFKMYARKALQRCDLRELVNGMILEMYRCKIMHMVDITSE